MPPLHSLTISDLGYINISSAVPSIICTIFHILTYLFWTQIHYYNDSHIILQDYQSNITCVITHVVHSIGPKHGPKARIQGISNTHRIVLCIFLTISHPMAIRNELKETEIHSYE
jgi:hypothetical protein